MIIRNVQLISACFLSGCIFSGDVYYGIVQGKERGVFTLNPHLDNRLAPVRRVTLLQAFEGAGFRDVQKAQAIWQLEAKVYIPAERFSVKIMRPRTGFITRLFRPALLNLGRHHYLEIEVASPDNGGEVRSYQLYVAPQHLR